MSGAPFRRGAPRPHLAQLRTDRRIPPQNELLKQLATDAGRDEAGIERAMAWTDAKTADAFLGEGVTLFTTEIHPDERGYDFSELEKMLAWRKQ